MLIAGIVGSRFIVAALFGSITGPAEPRIIAQADTATPVLTATVRPTSTPTATMTPRPTSTPRPTATTPATTTLFPTATATPLRPTAVVAVSVKRTQPRQVPHHTAGRTQILHHTASQKQTLHHPATGPSVKPQRPLHRTTVKATVKPTATKPTATPLPTPSPTPGIVTLVRYWVGTPDARHGQTISVGYVIDNETGRTAQLMLGASIKSDRILSWGESLSDPAHDVVAVVPPGVSTHVRYFTLPSGLKPGSYAVAWGLRDALSGERTALVAAPSALQVTR
jgi:hypothetical protein